MTEEVGPGRRAVGVTARAAGRLGRAGSRALTSALGGRERTRVILLLASVLALASADTATVGASALQLRSDLHINNTDVGLLVTVTSLVAAAASLPFGVLADRVTRTRILGGAIVLWGAAMIWSATAPTFGQLLLARLFLGAVTAAAGPIVASLVGDWFAAAERGRIYSYILSGELVGAAIGFSVTGGIATLSWRAAFVNLALPAFLPAWLIFHLPAPGAGPGRQGPAADTRKGAPDPRAGRGGGRPDDGRPAHRARARNRAGSEARPARGPAPHGLDRGEPLRAVDQDEYRDHPRE